MTFPNILVGIIILLVSTSEVTAVHTGQFRQQNYKVRHLREDRQWARRTGLPAAAIRNLRLLAGVPDDSDTLIDSLDAHSLRTRRQVLLVTTSGNGHCLDLYVFDRGNRVHRLIWSATQMPGGAGYCRDSPRDPTAYVRAGEIVVEIPTFDYVRGRSGATAVHKYVWDGKVYRYAGVRSAGSGRSSGRALRRTAQSNYALNRTRDQMICYPLASVLAG